MHRLAVREFWGPGSPWSGDICRSVAILLLRPEWAFLGTDRGSTSRERLQKGCPGTKLPPMNGYNPETLHEKTFYKLESPIKLHSELLVHRGDTCWFAFSA